MPLKLIERPQSPFWQLRGTVRGIRIRESTGVPIANRRQAEEVRATREAEVLTQSVHGRAATATFAEACNSYLKTGGKKRTGGSPRFMMPVLKHFGTTQLSRIGLKEIEDGAAKVYPHASPQTRNRQFYTPAVAVLRHGAQRGLCQMPIIARPQFDEGEPRWLKPDEAERLIDGARGPMRALIVFLLYTGARAGEALWLDWRSVDLARAHVTFPKTKNGEVRGVPLHPRAVAELANLPQRDGDVFRRPDGRSYARPRSLDDTSAGARIRKAFGGACRRAGITGFTPHDCRHTWATWHYIGNRDLGALKKLGGWKSEKMVLRYAHVNVGELAHTIDRLPTGTNLTHTADDASKSA